MCSQKMIEQTRGSRGENITRRVADTKGAKEFDDPPLQFVWYFSFRKVCLKSMRLIYRSSKTGPLYRYRVAYLQTGGLSEETILI